MTTPICAPFRASSGAVLRKAIESDLTVTRDDHVEHLHRIYAESVRNLGTPVFPRRWFASLLARFGDDAVVTTVHAAGKPVASVLSLVANGTIQPLLRRRRRQCAAERRQRPDVLVGDEAGGRARHRLV